MSRKRSQAQEQDAPVADREPGDEVEQTPIQAPNPRSWAVNSAAGIEMLEHREPYERWLKFRDGKPPQEVIDLVKENGFRWSPQEQVWAKPVAFKTQAQDRLVADRTYRQVVDMMLKAKGLEPEQQVEQGAPF